MNKWKCPICHNKAYQKWGGKTERATQVMHEATPGLRQSGTTAPKDFSYKDVDINISYHFMCKGCSVFFNNPQTFNLKNVKAMRKAHGV